MTMNKNQKIYEKINQAVRLLCDVYEILNEEQEEIESSDNENRLLKIGQFLKIHPEFTNGQIRWYIHQNTKDFNEKVTIRMGKSIFINETKFFQWLKGQDEG